MTDKVRPGSPTGSGWILLVLLVPLALVLLRGGNGFAYPSAQAAFSDITLSHYTNTAFLSDQLRSGGGLPLWAGTILSGYPFAANPLSGLWYPFGWPALILPLPLAFNLLTGLHLSWGALGVYLLLRRLGLGAGPAVFGGLAFGLLPKLYAHYGAGHLTLMYAVPWTPWLLLASMAQDPARRLRRLLLPGVVLALIFLADVRWAAYAGALWIFWTLGPARSITESNPPPAAPARSQPTAGLAGRLIVPLLVTVVLAAVLWLPLLEYTRLSTRASLTPAEVFGLSLSPAGLLGLLFPPLAGGGHETTLYPGASVLLLALLGGLTWRQSPGVRFWALAALAALAFSFGEYLPGFALLARLPLVSLLRVPPRALFLLGLALAVLAAYALENWPILNNQLRRRSRLLIVGLLSFTLLSSLLVLLWAQPDQPGPFLWGALAFSAAGALLLTGLRQATRPGYLLAGALVLLVFDSGLSGQAMLAYQSPEKVQAPDAALATFLAGQPGRFRTYSPGFSLLQHNAYTHNLETTDGVDPLQLSAYADFMQAASGVPEQGYSVTLPPLADGLESNRSYTPNPELLGLLNVRYLLADFPLPAVAGLTQVQEIEGTRIYENLDYRPRAWVAPDLAQATSPDAFIEAEILVYTPNRIVIQADGPGVLALAEVYYPGWQVRLDGIPATSVTVENLLRAVELPPGRHQVEWIFRPTSVLTGAAASGLGWLALGMIFWPRRRPHQFANKNG